MFTFHVREKNSEAVAMSSSAESQQIYEDVKQVESNARTYARRFTLTVQKAEGVYLYDMDGTKYLDALGNAGTNSCQFVKPCEPPVALALVSLLLTAC